MSNSPHQSIGHDNIDDNESWRKWAIECVLVGPNTANDAVSRLVEGYSHIPISLTEIGEMNTFAVGDRSRKLEVQGKTLHGYLSPA